MRREVLFKSASTGEEWIEMVWTSVRLGEERIEVPRVSVRVGASCMMYGVGRRGRERRIAM